MRTVLRQLPEDEFGVRRLALIRFHEWQGFDVPMFYLPSGRPSGNREAFVQGCLSACLDAMEFKGQLPPALIVFTDLEAQPTVMLVCPGATVIDVEINTDICCRTLSQQCDGEPFAVEVHPALPEQHLPAHAEAVRYWATEWGKHLN